MIKITKLRIRLTEGAEFRPGMSVSATVETRTHSNVISAPIASVTTRVPKSKDKNKLSGAATNAVPTNTMAAVTATNGASPAETNAMKADKKGDEKLKPVEVVFVVTGDQVKSVPVKIGISDDNYWEITDGLKEGDEIVTGGYRAIGHDLDDGKRIQKGVATDKEAEKPKA